MSSTEVVASACDILDSVNLSSDAYKSVLERYYTPMYCVEISGTQIDHHCVLFHSNRICMVTLAPTHPVIKEQKTISKVNCNVTDALDRMKNKVIGKGKRGGQKLNPDTVLCFVECTDGTSYKISSCVQGKLIEMNELLVDDPNLLVTNTNTKGHLAILLCNLSTVELRKDFMLTEEKYNEKFNSTNST